MSRYLLSPESTPSSWWGCLDTQRHTIIGYWPPMTTVGEIQRWLDKKNADPPRVKDEFLEQLKNAKRGKLTEEVFGEQISNLQDREGDEL